MPLSTYTELQSSVRRSIKRSDLDTSIDDWIAMFEKDMNILLHRREMSVRATTATVAGTQNYALPTDFGDAISLNLNTTPKKELVPSDWVRISTVYTEQGQPEEWAITSNEIVLGPIPDAVYTMELYYYRTIPSLLSTSTNWLLGAYPRLYLFGTLVQSVGVIDDQQQHAWALAYQDALGNLKRDQIRERGFGGGPILRVETPFGLPYANILTDE